jgi:hypothetical protein
MDAVIFLGAGSPRCRVQMQMDFGGVDGVEADLGASVGDQPPEVTEIGSGTCGRGHLIALSHQKYFLTS